MRIRMRAYLTFDNRRKKKLPPQFAAVRVWLWLAYPLRAYLSEATEA